VEETLVERREEAGGAAADVPIRFRFGLHSLSHSGALWLAVVQ